VNRLPVPNKSAEGSVLTVIVKCALSGTVSFHSVVVLHSSYAHVTVCIQRNFTTSPGVPVIVQWRWLQNGYRLLITPGRPLENPYFESFFDKLRQECLNCCLFGNVQEAQSISNQWRQECNQHRPHSSLNCKTPHEFVRRHEAGRSDHVVVEPRPEGARTDESGGGEFVRSHLPIPLHRNDERQLDRAQSVWHDTYVE
jgi:hypothetical protein